MNVSKNGKAWFNEKEATRTTLPYKLTFWTLRLCPRPLTNFITWCVAFFYYVSDSRCRTETRRYQQTLKSYCPQFKKVRPLRQLTSFAINIVEKIDCWTKPVPLKNIHFNQDDVYDLIDRLNKGQGAFVIISHLGNFEVLRALATANKTGVQRAVPFSILSDRDVSSNFSAALNSFNPDWKKNTVNDNSITPATIEQFMDTIANGGVVVCAGDRLSKNSSDKIVSQNFLGKSAPYPYGPFFLASLLKAPVYMIFGFRKNDLIFGRKFEMFVCKAKTEVFGPRKFREQQIQELCKEYSATLENFVKQYPYQWYNFFDFWKFPESLKKEGSE